jgi:hypothetical protein
MLVSARYFLNDTMQAPGRPVYSAPDNGTLNPVTNKFDFIVSNPTTASLTLELWNLRINRRIVKRNEFITNPSTTFSPLTSLVVGNGGQPVTTGKYIRPITGLGAPDVNNGIDNYTNFINRILTKFGIASKVFPMGKNYIPPGAPLGQTGSFDSPTKNLIGFHLSILEDFALTFVERPLGMNDFFSIPRVIHIETMSPMSINSVIREFNEPTLFNGITSPLGSTQFILDRTNYFRESRYEIIP